MKQTQTCPGPTPYFLCVSNRHCAYFNKQEMESYQDLVPFVESGGKCMCRGKFSDSILKGAEKGIELLNWLTNG